MKREPAKFKNEAAMCSAFIASLPDGWTAYPETGGFDILLVRADDGYQVGIEAKTTLNAIVIAQIAEGYWDACANGPDFRAVLVPRGKVGSFGGVCSLLGITVIEMNGVDDWRFRHEPFRPPLPKNERQWSMHTGWHDLAPSSRVALPDYVPDVTAGNPAPVQLTPWKIKAIKIAVLLERRGYVTRDDFKFLQLDHRRWLAPGYRWLAHGGERGRYVAGSRIGDFRAQHPTNYEQIASDFDKWAPKERAA